jgi:hypothetical protein
MPKLKCWKKSGMLSSRGIYGINGNYIWVNRKNPQKVLEIQSVEGGGTTIRLHGKSEYPKTLPESGVGFKHRKIALKFAQGYMRGHDRC